MRCLATLFFLSSTLFSAAAFAEERAAEGEEVVLRRLYPKARTFEITVSAGMILNPTFVNTNLFSLNAGYHWSEAWGLSLGLTAAKTTDRHERSCVESFYNDPDHAASAPCASEDGGAAASGGKSNVGPAYVPIRELKGMITVAADYTVAYGKQIILTGAVTNFDLRLRFGGGVLASTVYDERTTVIGSDRASRGDPSVAGVSDPSQYGSAARPEPRSETTPVLLLGIQEEVYFLKRFFVTGELTWYMTTGAKGGIDPFFVAQLGTGMKL